MVIEKIEMNYYWIRKSLTTDKLILFLMLPLLVLFSSCNKTIEGVKLTNYYDACTISNIDFGEMATYKDPSNLFSIRFPYSWDIRESYSDTLYGLFGANLKESSADIKKLISISAIAYQSTDSIMEYAKSEIRGLKSEKGIAIKEAGKTEINGQESIWVLFKSDEELATKVNLVVYIKKPGSNSIFILQASIYSSDNYKKKLCNLKQILNTFKINSND